MRKLLPTTAIMLSILSANSLFAKQIDCHVFKVYDGDTVTCSTSKGTNYKQDKDHIIKVRLAQIDAPEAKQDYGIKSRDYLRRLVLDKDVTLDVWEKDRYGRTVAKILLNGNDINFEMVKTGNAWAYVEYMKEDKYLAAQKAAQAKKIGLWVDVDAQKPSDFRKGKPKINHKFDAKPKASTTFDGKLTADDAAQSEEIKSDEGLTLGQNLTNFYNSVHEKATVMFSVIKGIFDSVSGEVKDTITGNNDVNLNEKQTKPQESN